MFYQHHEDRSDLFDHCCRALRKHRGDAETTELLKIMTAVDWDFLGGLGVVHGSYIGLNMVHNSG